MLCLHGLPRTTHSGGVFKHKGVPAWSCHVHCGDWPIRAIQVTPGRTTRAPEPDGGARHVLRDGAGGAGSAGRRGTGEGRGWRRRRSGG